MINNSTRYAMYLRKSRKDLELEEQGEGETLSRHLKILEDLCTKLKIVIADEDIYKEVVSGESIEIRPEIQKILSKVENGYYKGVFVVEIERLARGDSIDQGIILRTFKLSDTKIITPIKIYDFKQQIDEEYIEFGLFMSRREYKIISNRLLRGRNLSAKEGKFVGSHAPYGYNRMKLQNAKGYTLMLDKEKADIVKMIFNMYSNQLIKVPEICRHLNSLSIPSPSNNAWTPDGIRRILKNPAYAGYIRYNNRVTTTSMQDGNIIKSFISNKGDVKELILVEGLHQSIISKETFNKTIQIMKGNYIPPANQPLKNPLAGLVRCKYCDRLLATSKDRHTKRVYCKTLNCPNKGHNLQQLEEQVLVFLTNWLKNKELLYSKNDDYNTVDNKKILLKNSLLELEKLKSKKDQIFDLFEEGIYDKKTFFERNEKVTSIIDNTVQQIKSLQEEIQKIESINSEKEQFIPNLKYVLQNYKNTTDPQQKNFLLKSIIDKIYYLKKETGNRWNPADIELWVLPKMNKD